MHTQQNVIARVGNAILTREDAKAYVDTTRLPYDDQVRVYAARWVNDELIYQEALRNKIEDEKQFQEQLAQAHRQMAIQRFIEQKLGNDAVSLSEQSMKEYFQNHSQEFVVDDDVLKLNLITFNTRERANSFAGAVQTGTSWSSAVSMVNRDSQTVSDIVSSATDVFYTERTLYPIDLWRVASSLSPGEISFPVKTSIGYSILQVLSVAKRGSPAEYAIVRNEVRERYFIEQRQRRFDELLKKLRQQYNVEISITDTAKSIFHE